MIVRLDDWWRLVHAGVCACHPPSDRLGPILQTMRQHLIIDADDTLWENNIYFERAFDEFIDFLAHSTLPPADVRAVLNEIEDANARIHGYGSQSFGRNLQQCYERLAERAIGERRSGHGHELRRADSRPAH